MYSNHGRSSGASSESAVCIAARKINLEDGPTRIGVQDTLQLSAYLLCGYPNTHAQLKRQDLGEVVGKPALQYIGSQAGEDFPNSSGS